MNQNRMRAGSRSLTSVPSRRDVLRGLVAAGLGLSGARLPVAAAANKRKKPKRPMPNGFGCLSVGVACKNAGQCCSGICAERKNKRTCRAHNTGICNQAFPGLCSDPPTLAPCNSSETCYCIRTTANSNFCAQLGAPVCADCRKDADCAALGMPPGSACLPAAAGICGADCPETGTVCLPPCGRNLPDPPAAESAATRHSPPLHGPFSPGAVGRRHVGWGEMQRAATEFRGCWYPALPARCFR